MCCCRSSASSCFEVLRRDEVLDAVAQAVGPGPPLHSTHLVATGDSEALWWRTLLVEPWLAERDTRPGRGRSGACGVRRGRVEGSAGHVDERRTEEQKASAAPADAFCRVKMTARVGSRSIFSRPRGVLCD